MRTMQFDSFAVAGWMLAASLAVFAGEAFAADSAPPPDDSARRTLAEHGIQPTAEDIRKYLDSLEPSPEETRRIDGLIRQLGDDDFFLREEAMAELLRQPAASIALLERAVAGSDPEIRWRAGRLLEHGRGKNARILLSAYRVIERSRIQGVAPQVLSSMVHCDDDFHQRAAERALAATVLPEDAPLLRQALAAEVPARRIAAVSALVALLGDAARPDLAPLLEADADDVRYHAAVALVNLEDRAALEVLGELLDSDDLQVRAKSAQSLRAVSGERLPFVAYETAENRAAAARAWRNWIAAQGGTAELALPIDLAAPHFDRTLICCYSPGKVVEVDAAGKRLWEINVAGPWGCQGLPNGHRLVASHNNHTVVEYDDAGKEVWKATVPSNPFSVQRIENGNTLVAVYGNRSLVEIRPDRSIAWRIDTGGQPTDARRLDDGNTLTCLSDQNKVVEFDRQGKSVWEVAGMNGPRSASRLDNGHTLVVQSNARKVVEVDREGRVVWSKQFGTNLFDAQRLPNGNTLVGTQQGVQEFDADGNVVWEHAGNLVCRLSRY
ncbi:MAG: PQQ-binding-like beta-propeller repeat protein [Planctomycetaceae bacterium]